MSTRQPAANDEFYVGYLPVPTRQKQFVRVLLGALLASVVFVGVLIAALQRDPGSGVWNLDDTTVYDGLLLTKPCPMLLMADKSQPGVLHAVLLVADGKHGAAGLAAPFSGQAVRLRGHVLARGHANMLELEDTDTAIIALPGAAAFPSPAGLTPAGPASSFRGEIIDPKCYNGTMKPGEGKVHKACAALCIRGGIPPMFVTLDGHGERTCLLLVNEQGESLTGDALERVIDFVGEPVTLSGQPAAVADLHVLRMNPASIQRE